MQPLAGLHIASFIDKNKYDITLHHETWYGVYDTKKIGKYDIVFLSGIQKDFDRMRQLSYFFQKNGALVVAGGSICTLFPEFAKRFFNVVCAGGVECVAEVIKDYENNSIKEIYKSPQNKIGSYKLDHSVFLENGINNVMHLIEASRGCNFKCDFCTLPAEDATHATYGIEAVAEAINDSIENSSPFSFKRVFPIVWFTDNNFSNNIKYMVALCDYLRKERKIKFWGAVVTQNIFKNKELIKLLAASKCRSLFTGLESLDPKFLETHNKKQNVSGTSSIIEDIRYIQKQGILVMYGYLFDPRISTIQELKNQLQMILEVGDISFPGYIFVVTPLAGTKLFWKCVKNKELLPDLRLRDMEGHVITFKNSIDGTKAVGDFLNLYHYAPYMFINKKRLLMNTFRYIKSSGQKNPILWYIHYKNNYRIFHLSKKPSEVAKRNYIGGQEILDPQYNEYPPDITLEDKKRYFDPIMVTDRKGNVSEWLRDYIPPGLKL
ncbi:B12-binding domain-containing radical SAM protein [Acidobacteriota bacterium]